MLFLTRVLLAATALTVIGCDNDGASGAPPDEPLSNFFRPIPEAAVYPEDNQYSLAKESLGEMLFWDPILSGQKNVACATCHHPDHGWADGRSVSVGFDGVGLGPARVGASLTEVNSPTVLNVAFAGLRVTEADEAFVAGPYFWDSRAKTLEEQALQPIQNPVEMLGHNVPTEQSLPMVVARLQAIPEYVELFEIAFADEEAITPDTIAKALATFQRKLITSQTRFDRYLQGDSGALSLREITGLNKFVNGGCARCHQGVLLSDFTIHEDQPVLRDLPAVRTPPLRTAAYTGPFMHNGSRQSLSSAIDEYVERGDLDVTFDDDDVADVEAFLRVLADDNFYRVVPSRVPSGLTVGGNIH